MTVCLVVFRLLENAFLILSYIPSPMGRRWARSARKRGSWPLNLVNHCNIRTPLPTASPPPSPYGRGTLSSFIIAIGPIKLRFLFFSSCFLKTGVECKASVRESCVLVFAKRRPRSSCRSPADHSFRAHGQVKCTLANRSGRRRLQV